MAELRSGRPASSVRLAVRRLPWLLASLVALGAVVLVWPVSAVAIGVTFEPPEGRPGTTVSIPGGPCGLAQDDQVWFSDRFVPQLPDGQTEFFKPVAAVALTPVGGELTENGIVNTIAQTFVVPKLPAGDYYLYAACTEASACCVPLQPTFRVLAAPDTATYSRVPYGTAPLWPVLGLAFAVGGAMMAFRLRSTNSARRRPPC